MTIILDGKKFAEKISDKIKNDISGLSVKPKLAVVSAGDDAASKVYVKNKQKKALEIGFDCLVVSLPSDVSEDNLLEQIYLLNDEETINGIIVQLPLPSHINKERILEAVDPTKDADGFTSYNIGRLFSCYTPYAVPCTPKGIIALLKYYNVEISGKHVVVAGRSQIVGKPVAVLFERENATVTVVHSKTKKPGEILKTADIIVSAVGKPGFITSDYVKDGAIIVDVGISRTSDGLKGDVDFNSVSKKVSYITPVPGGVGPVTVAMLMQNTYELFQIQQKLKK